MRQAVPLRAQHHRPAAHQRGAAALVVVMLLFFLISLAAAYTSRNLIFEQRTAANQYRSTQALEAAEAGVEWALAQLNGGLINESCTATTTSTDQSFRQRYLDVDSTNGNITPRVASLPGSVEPMCGLDTSSTAANWRWSCSCPPINAALATAFAPPVGPAFTVQLVPAATGAVVRPDLIQLEVNSCTRFSIADCVNFNFDRGGTGDGVATVRVMLALRGSLSRLPAAALTVAGTLAAPPSSVLLTLRNESVASNGITLHTAGSWPAIFPVSGLALLGLPGVAPARTVVTLDPTLSPAAQPGFIPLIGSPVPTVSPSQTPFSAQDLRFASFFGMRPDTYRRQPGLPVLDCSSGCTAADINTAIARNPGRPIWLSGNGTVTIDANVPATAGTSAMLIVEGNMAFAGGSTLRGLLYNRGANTQWSLSGSSTIVGAAVIEGNLSASGASAAATVIYDRAALLALRAGTGTFVRVPGSWKDFL